MGGVVGTITFNCWTKWALDAFCSVCIFTSQFLTLFFEFFETDNYALSHAFHVFFCGLMYICLQAFRKIDGNVVTAHLIFVSLKMLWKAHCVFCCEKVFSCEVIQCAIWITFGLYLSSYFSLMFPLVVTCDYCRQLIAWLGIPLLITGPVLLVMMLS